MLELIIFSLNDEITLRIFELIALKNDRKLTFLTIILHVIASQVAGYDKQLQAVMSKRYVILIKTCHDFDKTLLKPTSEIANFKLFESELTKKSDLFSQFCTFFQRGFLDHK